MRKKLWVLVTAALALGALAVHLLVPHVVRDTAINHFIRHEHHKGKLFADVEPYLAPALHEVESTAVDYPDFAPVTKDSHIEVRLYRSHGTKLDAWFWINKTTGVIVRCSICDQGSNPSNLENLE